MKNKIGFNLIFAGLAFSIGLALFRELDVQTFTFKNPPLGFIYLVTFLATVFLTFKKNLKSDKKN